MADYTFDGKNWRDGGGRVVTGPLAAQLNDRAKAQINGVNYDEVSKTKQYQDSFKKYGSGFKFGADEHSGTNLGKGLLSGFGDVFLGASQAVHHGLSSAGIESDAQKDYYDALARMRGEELGNAPFATRVGRIAGDMAVPLPFGKAKAATLSERLLQGAAQGGAAGLEMPAEGEGGYGTQKLSQGTLGAFFGAPLNAALGKLADRGLASQAPSMADVRMQAGARQGMGLGYAQVTDSGPVRMFANISSRLPGGRALRSQAQDTVNKFDQRVADATAATGRTLERSELGQHLEKTLGKNGGFTSRFQDEADKNFAAITRDVHPTTQVKLDGTVKSMNDVVEAFPSNPALGERLQNPQLRDLASRMVDDEGKAIPLFFNEAQYLRSKIGRMMGEPELINGIPRRELAKVYSAITADMRKSLTEQPDALKAFDQATKHYKAGMARIHAYIEPVVTASSHEAMADKVINLVKNNAKGIAAIRRSVSPEEWDTVAASIFHKLGEATPGERGATNAGFSIPKFLTDFNKLRSNDKAFNFAFGGTRYAKLRQTYADLAEISDAVKQSVKQANPSYSGYTGGGLALGAALLTNIPTAMKAIGGNYVFAHLMAHPTFARWLVNMGRVVRRGNVKNGRAAELAMRAQIAKLPAIAAANSEIKQGVDHVYHYFLTGGASPNSEDA
jgi:hypothetical protein